MKMKKIATIVGALILVFMATSYANTPAPDKFTPVGTWEYNVPGVPDGYDRGVMVISEGEEGLIVSIGPSEDYLAPTHEVEYTNGKLSFKIFVEDEEVVVTGEFDKDQFSGKVSYVEGIFDLTAERLVEP